MIFDFLNRQKGISVDELNVREDNMKFKLEFLKNLFYLSIKTWPEKQKETIKFQVDFGDSLTPVARAFPGGLYRIIFPVRMLYELEQVVYGPGIKKHRKKSEETRVVLICLMLCLAHEMIHCVRGHLDNDVDSIKSEETDADFMAGGMVWGWIHNQLSFLKPYGFLDEEQGGYEMGYASTVLTSLFQKYHFEDDGYHLPRQRLLTFMAGYINPVKQTQGNLAARKIGQLQEAGVSAAKLLLSERGFDIHLQSMFDNPDNDSDYYEVMGKTNNRRDEDINEWHRASFLLEPIKKLLFKFSSKNNKKSKP
ncbi:hypothetical protein [Aliidiomarina sp. B3213]|nr:hypothetical protein [Aliidiomarina sp. B3213]RTE86568.1 hypothetical protein DQX04_08420 [Aliidiomarina sp. B3213]TCZ90877.1 hypothetical protein EYQ95_08625 [Lysobacter sp. N42]